ncbi:MAG TPA: response regulator, partial [Vicinamibacterales bacterium]|nr:response regulator [Vicinamibacterales bacterium]
AIKFTDPGGTVTIASSADAADVIQISVTDTGVGMEPDVVDSINADDDAAHSIPIQSSSGLGLGLAICRGVVGAHGGTLRAVSSGQGNGSTFIVQIPIASHLEQWDQPTTPAHPQPDTRPRQLRILLVEDHVDSADMLSQLLTLHGYEVTVARTIEGAAARAAEGFDLLISDIRLPDGSGLDLMRRLRSAQDIRGIAVSGFGTEQDRRRSQDAGYDVHLTKPVDFDRLLDAIEQVSASRGGTN